MPPSSSSEVYPPSKQCECEFFWRDLDSVLGAHFEVSAEEVEVAIPLPVVVVYCG